MRVASLLCAVLLCGCGDPCAKEAHIAENKCGFELAPDGNNSETECDGLARKEARCASAHRADFCQWLEALDAGTVVENDYTNCLLE